MGKGEGLVSEGRVTSITMAGMTTTLAIARMVMIRFCFGVIIFEFITGGAIAQQWIEKENGWRQDDASES